MRIWNTFEEIFKFQKIIQCIPIFNDRRQILFFCLCVFVYYEKNSAKYISGLFLNSAREKNLLTTLKRCKADHNGQKIEPISKRRQPTSENIICIILMYSQIVFCIVHKHQVRHLHTNSNGKIVVTLASGHWSDTGITPKYYCYSCQT